MSRPGTRPPAPPAPRPRRPRGGAGCAPPPPRAGRGAGRPARRTRAGHRRGARRAARVGRGPRGHTTAETRSDRAPVPWAFGETRRGTPALRARRNCSSLISVRFSPSPPPSFVIHSSTWVTGWLPASDDRGRALPRVISATGWCPRTSASAVGAERTSHDGARARRVDGQLGQLHRGRERHHDPHAGLQRRELLLVGEGVPAAAGVAVDHPGDPAVVVPVAAAVVDLDPGATGRPPRPAGGLVVRGGRCPALPAAPATTIGGRPPSENTEPSWTPSSRARAARPPPSAGQPDRQVAPALRVGRARRPVAVLPHVARAGRHAVVRRREQRDPVVLGHHLGEQPVHRGRGVHVAQLVRRPRVPWTRVSSSMGTPGRSATGRRTPPCGVLSAAARPARAASVRTAASARSASCTGSRPGRARRRPA